MRYVVPFHAAHILALKLQPAQAWIGAYLTEPQLRTLENEWAVTLMDDGVPLGSAGAVPWHQNRALVWSFVGDRITKRIFVEVHLLARQWLRGLPFRRLEAAIDIDFAAGHRWATLLGFTVEAERMRGYMVDGRDCALYAMVRD